MSVVFVDYDNIYLSLKRKNEEASRRFAKDAGAWLRGIENGRLITPTQGVSLAGPRRVVLNRCYGNPAPRRNPTDNSTDMSSFPFVRHFFLRAGFEVVDCPPLTSQLKNTADIKMVIDVLDHLEHQTTFDEFILLSGDADFTPVLHRLRAHARRTVVYANDHTATPYTAISDGEVREADLISLLMDGRIASEGATAPLVQQETRPQLAQLDQLATAIMTEVANVVRAAGQPVPLEALADRATRVLGHERTVGSAWAGAGSFRELIARKLPAGLRMSDQPPYYIFDASRNIATEAAAAREQRRIEMPRVSPSEPGADVRPAAQRPAANPYAPATSAAQAYAAAKSQPPAAAPARSALAPQPAAAAQRGGADSAAAIQLAITRIHKASKAPPLSAPNYRALFEAMAEEITANGLSGAQTLDNISQRALQRGADVHTDYIRLVMEVVSEPDPWFEQGATAILLATRFRNYVIAQCRRAGMAPSATEMDLIEMWFMGSNLAEAKAPPPRADGRAAGAQPADRPREPGAPPLSEAAGERWWHADDGALRPEDQEEGGDDLPRIVRTRLRT